MPDEVERAVTPACGEAVDDPSGHLAQVEVLADGRRLAEPGQVEREHRRVPRELTEHDQIPDAAVGGDPVQQHQRLAVPTSSRASAGGISGSYSQL